MGCTAWQLGLNPPFFRSVPPRYWIIQGPFKKNNVRLVLKLNSNTNLYTEIEPVQTIKLAKITQGISVKDINTSPNRYITFVLINKFRSYNAIFVIERMDY